MTKSTFSFKDVSYVGGESNADLIFQLATDSTSAEIDWNNIASIVGQPVTAEKAMTWFSSITLDQMKVRWTTIETDILKSLVFEKSLTRKEISMIFSHRSKRAIALKIDRLTKERKQTQD